MVCSAATVARSRLASDALCGLLMFSSSEIFSCIIHGWQWLVGKPLENVRQETERFLCGGSYGYSQAHISQSVPRIQLRSMWAMLDMTQFELFRKCDVNPVELYDDRELKVEEDQWCHCYESL